MRCDGARREKWGRWLERIGEDLLDLAVCTHIYRELSTIVAANPALRVASSYWYFQRLTYEHYAVAALRRQVKDSDDSLSLARLLRELADNPELAVRPIESQAVKDDLDRMRACLEKFETLADRRVAHLDKREPPEWPEEADLFAAVEALQAVYQRSRVAILDGPWNFGLPTSVGDWRTLFKRAWITGD